MNFNKTHPCDNCPFRSDVDFHLLPEMVEEILDAITNQTFACHKTTDKPDSEHEHCAGALILLEREENPNQMMRIAERLGMYDRTKLDMQAPVFESPDDMQAVFNEREAV